MLPELSLLLEIAWDPLNWKIWFKEAEAEGPGRVERKTPGAFPLLERVPSPRERRSWATCVRHTPVSGAALDASQPRPARVSRLSRRSKKLSQPLVQGMLWPLGAYRNMHCLYLCIEMEHSGGELESPEAAAGCLLLGSPSDPCLR